MPRPASWLSAFTARLRLAWRRLLGDETGRRLDQLEEHAARVVAHLSGLQAHATRIEEAAVEARLQALTRDGAALAGRVAGLGARARESEEDGARQRRLERDLGALEARIAHLEAFTLDLGRDAAQQREHLERLARIAAVTLLVRTAGPQASSVSVVLTTRDRLPLLRTAVASVLAQSHEGWELLVVDDGSTDGTWEYLSALEDPRIRSLRGAGTGVSAARNQALGAARGEIVTYLDDDNTMAPDWLKGVAWAFAAHAGAQVLYGAQVVEDAHPTRETPPLERRLWIRFEPWDRRRLERGNYVDLGAIAHRRGPVRFDESLPRFEDWDLFLRLTREAAPLAFPLLCGVYRSSGPVRRSDAPVEVEALERVRAKIPRG